MFVELFVTSSFTECHHRPQWALLFGCGVVVSSSSPFFLFRVSASSFQYLRSPALCSVSLSLFCFTYHSTSVSVFPYFAVHSLLSSTFPLLYLLQSFSTHGPTISVSLLLFSHLCCPHLPICFYFFIPDLLNPLYSHHPFQHSHF